MELKHKTFGSVSNETEKVPEKMSKNDLMSLIELGCIKEEVKIGNLTFILKSLSAAERLDLSKVLSDNPTADSLFEFNVKLLALAIESVNGQPLESLLDSNPNDDPFKIKCDIISSLQAPVINKLLACQTELTQRSDAQFDSEQVKN